MKQEQSSHRINQLVQQQSRQMAINYATANETIIRHDDGDEEDFLNLTAFKEELYRLVKD